MRGPVVYQQYRRLIVMANNTSHQRLYRFEFFADMAFSSIGSAQPSRVSAQSIVNVTVPNSWRILNRSTAITPLLLLL